MPYLDFLYFALRAVLCGITAVIAVVGLCHCLRCYRSGRPWILPAVGACLLGAAAVLSAYDGIDNVLLRPDAPIPLANWLWYFLFDLVMPIWALLAIKAREGRDRALAELLKLSVTDQLTGALNRRGFHQRAAIAIAQSRRNHGSPTLIMFDIDHFKTINDLHGHGAGDEVLRNLGAVLLASMRSGDLLGRLGGEEFAVFLQDGEENTAISTAERLRVAIRSQVPHPAGPQVLVTVSGGMVPIEVHFEPETALSLAISAADEALYTAKREGRDRIMTAIAAPAPGPGLDVSGAAA